MNADSFAWFGGAILDPLFLVSIDGTVIASNEGAKSRFVLPKTFDLLLEDSTGLDQFLRFAARTRKPVMNAFRMLTHDGFKSFRLEGTLVRPRSADSPALVILRCVCKEASAEQFKFLNERIQTSDAEIHRRMVVEASLKEQDRRKDEFLATLAHELRNPLAPIRTTLHIMKRSDGQNKHLDLMERQMSHLCRLIDDLLDVSRISRGKITLQSQRVALSEVIREGVDATRTCFEQSGNTLSVTLPNYAIYLVADLVRLVQIVSNLLVNASKFTDRGGIISLVVDVEGVEAVIRVKDNGIGIAANKISTIFDMFGQVDSSAKRSQGGLGIGLTLAKSFVEMHGGSISVVSEEGVGTEFVVRLPIEVGEITPIADESLEPATPSCGSNRCKILVVDDNKEAADTLVLLLQVMGHDAIAVYDGPSGLAAADDFRPRLMFQDLAMPGMSGFEVGEAIRKKYSTNELRLVALTGFGSDDDRLKTTAIGFDEHLLKPVDGRTVARICGMVSPWGVDE